MSARPALAAVAALAVAAGLAAGYLRACTGPRPIVAGARLEQLVAGGVRAVATIRNAGGEGQVEVQFRITDREGRIYTSEQSSQLRAGEQVEVSTWIGAPVGEYRIEVEAEYPPR